MKRLTALIVDDSLSMRMLIRRMVSAIFADVTALVASDGNEALAILAREPVDLIITDVNMPGLDGEGLMAALAADERLRAIPVLIMTSDATASRAGRMQRMGARGYIVKPFPAEGLRAEIEHILGVAHV